MIDHEIRDYQDRQLLEAAQSFAKGNRSIAIQLNTGGGKTVEFATMAWRFNTKSLKRVLIGCHRSKLMEQATDTLKEWYNVDSHIITQDTRYIYDSDVYVGMVETLFRRMNKNPKYLPPVGLVILDEAHMGNFKKMHQFFPDALISGFTATPIYSDKKYPMKNDYQDIIVGPQVSELISRGALCQNITYSVEGVDRSHLLVVRGQFDEEYMAKEYSKIRNVQNTIDNYEALSPGTKAICYNVNCEHSRIVTKAFRDRGYDCRNIDNNTPDDEKIRAYNWFKNSPNGILCNVGIATMGYDEPTIQTVILNFSTLSLVKYLQCGGRGGRPIDLNFIARYQHEYAYDLVPKNSFMIIDMGGNAMQPGFGDWNMDRDWKDKFWNPPKKGDKLDAAPYKICPRCKALVPLQSRTCIYCEYVFPQQPIKYDAQPVKLELYTTNLDVKRLLEENAARKDFHSLFIIENNLITQAKYKLNGSQFDKGHADLIISLFEEKAKEWCELTKREYNDEFKKFVRKHILGKLKVIFQYDPDDKKIVAIQPIDQLFSF